MKTCRYAVLALLGTLITLVCFPLSAQETSHVQQGDRVRVTFGTSEERQEIEGRFQGVEGTDLVVLSTETIEVHRIPTGQVDRFTVYRGKKRRTRTGSLLGLSTGFIVGVALGSSAGPDPMMPGLEVLGGAVLGVLTGGITGLVVGTFVKTDHWESVPLPSVQLSPDGRFGLRFSIPTRR